MKTRAASKRTARKRPSRTFLMLVGLLSLVLLLLTLRLPITVHDADQLEAVRFGHPLWFVEQDLRTLDPPSYPVVLTMGAPFEYPTRISRPRMTGSYLLVLFAVAVLLAVYRGLNRRRSSS